VLLEKPHAVDLLRDLVGVTNPETRRPGTIRYMYADSVTRNAVHASDSHDHALREIALIFPENEL
jgi:nucleoside-diphosphate kinase